MPDRHDEVTDDAENRDADGRLNRRKVLQMGAVGLSVGALGTAAVSGQSDGLPNGIVFDGTVSSGSATYEFLASGSVEVHPDIGSNDNQGSINRGHVTGDLGEETHAYRFSGELSYLDVTGAAEVRLLYGDTTPATDRLEVVASSDGAVDYEITSSDTVSKVTDNGDRSANSDDTVTENDDGTWTVTGSTANGNGDTYDFHGDVETFDPVTGEFTLFFNGTETTVTELTGQEVHEEEETNDETSIEREHWYSFEATGEEYADYYIEVEDGGDMVASTVDDAIVENSFHWINDDGTKAAGRVHPGDTHAYAFDTLVADITIDGEAHPTVDGVDSDLSNYPQDSASGDHWKGYFPWHIEGEERTHRYSFEATGEEYADYYIEVEEGGDLIPSTADGAVIEYEFFWIGDGGTKAAGRIDPGESHTYEFDTLVADVTIEGEAQATVNGSDSNLDLYPQDSASGDYWKTGFPWQEGDHEAPTDRESDTDVGIRHDLYEGPLGGGEGMPERLVYDASDADIVVSDGDVDGALASASNGDVVYVAGSADGFTADVENVTIAGNRGIGSDGQIGDNITVTADGVTLKGLTVSPGSGPALTIRAQWPVFYNCAFINASNRCIRVEVSQTGSTFTQCRFHNWSGYGIHHAFDPHDEEHKMVVEYSEFSDLGRHGISAGDAWYQITDCHMHGSIGLDPDHFIELRAPNYYGVNGGSAPVHCGSPCGNGIIEHNLNEMSGGTGKTRLVVVRGEPTEGAWIRNNRSPGNTAPTGGCWENSTHGGWGEQIVLQNASSTDSFSKVTIENNEL